MTISQLIWHSYGGPISSTARTATEIQARREEHRIRLMALCRAVGIGIDWEEVNTAMLVIFGLPESQQTAENYDAVYRCVSTHGRLPGTMDELEAMQLVRGPLGASITLEITPEMREVIRAGQDAILQALRGASFEDVDSFGNSASVLSFRVPHMPICGAIGNTACAHNAESPHLRCAVNPCGPCEGCPEFEAKP
jgi:hypothetical protein